MKRQLVLAIVAAVAISVAAQAFINPNFTPVDIFKQSDMVLLLEFKNVGEDGIAVGTVKKVLKGDYKEKEIKIDIMGNLPDALARQGKDVIDVINSGHRQAILFTGRFVGADEEGAGAGGEPEERGFLNIAYMPSKNWQWIDLDRYQDTWEMKQHNAYQLGTFAGSTDMLLRLVEYIKANPDAEVPIDSGVSWDKESKIGNVSGTVSATVPVDLKGDGKLSLFVAADGGDHLLAWNGTAFEDTTAKQALTSKSKRFAWGDFNGDGLADLVSWNGSALELLTQKADGTFAASAVNTGDALKDGCLGLAVYERSIVASTKAGPKLLVVAGDKPADAKAFGDPKDLVKDLGDAAECMVADLDGDALVDVLQLYANGSVFYKGAAGGTFASPVAAAPGKGQGRYGACMGDWDGDGLIDIYAVAEDGNRLWQNEGNGKFSELVGLSGEISYIAKSDGIACQTCDFSNDGRQDIFMAYTRQAPQLFFNRGYRSFGHARRVDLQVQNLLPPAGEGQQAGCVGDLNGDGAQDMTLVLKNGDIYFFPRKVNGKALGVTVVAPKGGVAGPIVVRGTRFERPLGGQVLLAGGSDVFFGAREAGPITLKWTLPGGKEQEQEVILEDGPVCVTLGAK